MYLYQSFMFLQGHLHYFLHFFLTFMESLFKKHPISELFSLRNPYRFLFAFAAGFPFQKLLTHSFHLSTVLKRCLSSVLAFCLTQVLAFCHSPVLAYCLFQFWRIVSLQFWRFLSLKFWRFVSLQFWRFVSSSSGV